MIQDLVLYIDLRITSVGDQLFEDGDLVRREFHSNIAFLIVFENILNSATRTKQNQKVLL